MKHHHGSKHGARQRSLLANTRGGSCSIPASLSLSLLSWYHTHFRKGMYVTGGSSDTDLPRSRSQSCCHCLPAHWMDPSQEGKRQKDASPLTLLTKRKQLRTLGSTLLPPNAATSPNWRGT